MEKEILGTISLTAQKKNSQKIKVKTEIKGSTETIIANMVFSLILELKERDPRSYLLLEQLVMQAEKEGKL